MLQKGPKGWLVADEFWHSDNGAGQVIDTGKDPDAAPVAASPADKYTDDIMAAVGKVWTDPAAGTGQVTVELKNSTSGHFELLGIKDKAGNKEAEALVKSALSGIVLPPLPTEVAEQPIVNIQLSWSPRSRDTMKMVHFSTVQCCNSRSTELLENRNAVKNTDQSQPKCHEALPTESVD